MTDGGRSVRTWAMNGLFILLNREEIKVADLERIYVAQGCDGSFASDAIGAMRQLDAELAWHAAWLLKRRARDRGLAPEDLVRLARCADEMPHWAARLCLCQLFAATGCPAEVRDALYPYLAECFAHRSPIIRAWALTALMPFKNDRIYQHSVDAMLRKARRDPAGSVQARLRRLVKNRGFLPAARSRV